MKFSFKKHPDLELADIFFISILLYMFMVSAVDFFILAILTL